MQPAKSAEIRYVWVNTIEEQVMSMTAVNRQPWFHDALVTCSKDPLWTRSPYKLHCYMLVGKKTYHYWFEEASTEKSICEINVPNALSDFPTIGGVFAADDQEKVWLLRKTTSFTTRPRGGISACLRARLANLLVDVQRNGGMIKGNRLDPLSSRTAAVDSRRLEG